MHGYENTTNEFSMYLFHYVCAISVNDERLFIGRKLIQSIYSTAVFIYFGVQRNR